MLIKKWIPSKHKTFPDEQNEAQNNPNAFQEKYKSLAYFTADIDEYFTSMSLTELETYRNEQLKAIDKEISILQRFDQLSEASARRIKEIYDKFIFYKWLYFKYQEVKGFIVWEQASNVIIGDIKVKQQIQEEKKLENQIDNQEQETAIQNQETNPLLNKLEQEIKPSTNKKVIQINREAIRKITWYSPYVVPKWDKDWKPVYIEWQEKLLNDDWYIVILDKSRQLWASYTLAELIVETSFIPNSDMLIGSFTKKNTDVIRNYILKRIKKFNDGVFEHFKSEWYILNTKSWTKIYFRTLDNGWENARWLTLKYVFVDEAQLVSTYAFTDVLEPTLATTNGRMFLIWTASKHKGYFYEEIIKVKKMLIEAGININQNLYWVRIGDYSYYRLDIYANKLISPRLKEKILANKDRASIKRERFCDWNSWDENLFKYETINEFPVMTNDQYYIITFDVAKQWKDRSTFIASTVINWIIYILQSWYVPDWLKSKWSSQIRFYEKWVLKAYWDYEKIIYWADNTGIGSGFVNEWEHTIKKSLIKISYTAWETQSIDWLDWKVSKSILITNTVDLMDEWKVKIVKATNKELIEELDYAFETEDRMWRIWMKSTFFDDHINALLTNTFIIKVRWILKRSIIITDKKEENFKSWLKEDLKSFWDNKKIKNRKKVW